MLLAGLPRDNNSLVIAPSHSLPPKTLKLPSPQGISVFPAEILLPIKTTSRGKETYLSWGEQKTIDKPGIVRIKGLVPGKYEINAHVSDMERCLNERIPFLYDRRQIEIKPGSVNRFEAAYPEIDSTIEPGDVTIRGIITNTERQPLPETVVQLIPCEGMNIKIDLYYPETKTDSNGLFEFTGIRPNIAVLLKCFQAGALLEQEIMKKNAGISVDIVVGSQMLVLRPDQPVANISINLKDKENCKLSDFANKTVVITLWASWCPLYKDALTKFNALAGQNTQKEDIVFIALNIDSDRKLWEKTIENAGWTNLRHGWYDLQNNTYAFNRPIPFSIIIGKDSSFLAAGYNLDIGSELEKIAKTASSKKD